MKKIIYLILFFISSFNVFSQTTTFNKTYTLYGNDPTTGFMASSVISKGNSFIISGNGYDTINNNYPSLYFYKVDSIGNVSKIKSFTRLGWNHYYNISSLIELKNGGYCYIGEMDTVNCNPEHFMIRFDANMDTLWTKIIPNDTVYWEALRQVQETSDNGLIFVGSREYTTNNLGVLLVKTDSLGNILWKKTLTNPGNGASRILETPDKGFLLKGFRESSLLGDGGPFIIKTDSVGNQEWLKYLGGNEYDGSASIAITKDNNILAAYGYSTYTYPFNEYWKARLNVIKFALDGNIIWNRFYDSIRMVLNVGKIQVLPNNDFIVMGLNSERDSFSFFSSFMFKFNANGDSLWRKIYYLKDGYVDENTLVDNVLNVDGGITACGWVSSNTQVPYQQIWILKTDSSGYAPGPQNVGIIDLPYLYVGYGGMKVYPNPANDFVIVEYTIDKIAKEVVFLVYDMQGRLQITQPLKNLTNQSLVDISKLTNATYQCKILIDGHQKAVAKIIVQH